MYNRIAYRPSVLKKQKGVEVEEEKIVVTFL